MQTNVKQILRAKRKNIKRSFVNKWNYLVVFLLWQVQIICFLNIQTNNWFFGSILRSIFFSFKTIVLVSQSGEKFHSNQYVVHAKSLHLYKISPQSTGTQGSKPVTLQLAARHWWEFVSSCQVINYKSKPSSIALKPMHTIFSFIRMF